MCETYFASQKEASQKAFGKAKQMMILRMGMAIFAFGVGSVILTPIILIIKQTIDKLIGSSSSSTSPRF